MRGTCRNGQIAPCRRSSLFCTPTTKQGVLARMARRLTILVNGKRHWVQATPDTPLLYVLRNELDLHGPRFGCGLAQCGACTVHVNGEAVRSCILPVSGARSKRVRTLEVL